MEPWQWILMAFGGVAMGYSLIQGAKSRRNIAARDSLIDAQTDIQELESSARGIVQQLEVRAYDYSREVEARIDNRLAVLDQLIVDADREIERLQSLLALSPQPVERELSPVEQQRCLALQETGCTIDEIARCLHLAPISIRRTLDQWQRPDKRAA